jgi:hypothetical protein
VSWISRGGCGLFGGRVARAHVPAGTDAPKPGRLPGSPSSSAARRASPMSPPWSVPPSLWFASRGARTCLRTAGFRSCTPGTVTEAPGLSRGARGSCHGSWRSCNPGAWSTASPRGSGGRAYGYGTRTTRYGRCTCGYTRRTGWYGSRTCGYTRRTGRYRSRTGGDTRRTSWYRPRTCGYTRRTGWYRPRTRGYTRRTGGYGSCTCGYARCTAWYRPLTGGYARRTERYRSRTCGYARRGRARRTDRPGRLFPTDGEIRDGAGAVPRADGCGEVVAALRDGARDGRVDR